MTVLPLPVAEPVEATGGPFDASTSSAQAGSGTVEGSESVRAGRERRLQ
jgi:hypothetical protein